MESAVLDIQRYYSIFTKVQTNLYSGIDMLNLGMIKECVESDWNYSVSSLNFTWTPHRWIIKSIGSYQLSTIWLKNVFWQIPLDVELWNNTAFTVPGWLAVDWFNVLSFRLWNASQHMSRLIGIIILWRHHDLIFVYLDALLTTSAAIEVYISSLKEDTQSSTRLFNGWCYCKYRSSS